MAWTEIALRLDQPSAETLHKQHERALARVAEQKSPVDSEEWF
ncbi:MAG: hypothetical protein WKF77_29795 [Planctomycetaceae bacterium]